MTNSKLLCWPIFSPFQAILNNFAFSHFWQKNVTPHFSKIIFAKYSHHFGWFWTLFLIIMTSGGQPPYYLRHLYFRDELYYNLDLLICVFKINVNYPPPLRPAPQVSCIRQSVGKESHPWKPQPVRGFAVRPVGNISILPSFKNKQIPYIYRLLFTNSPLNTPLFWTDTGPFFKKNTKLDDW